MATLNTLRTKGGWIVTGVIFIALLAFLIGDLAGGNSIFSAGGEKIGEIGGEKISYLEYAQKIEEMNQIQTTMNGGQSIPAEMQDQLREYAWETIKNDILLFPGLEKLGISVSDEELYDRIYGNNLSPLLTGSGLFSNADGQFDRALLQNFVTNYPLDPTGQMALLWQYIQDQVRQGALLEKYQALLGGMAYVTDAEADRGAERANTSYSARYVVQEYGSAADSTLNISSGEVRNYYNARKENYRRAASRSVEYVLFEVMPSAADYVDARAAVDQMAAEFATAENVQQYVALNSQEPFDAIYYTRAQLPSVEAEWAFNPAREPVYGPVQEGDLYMTVRVADTRSFPDTIAFRQMQFIAGSEALADSVFNVLRAGGNFETLAAEYSIVPANAIDAGRISTQGIPMELGEQIYNTNERLVKIENPAGGTMILELYYRGPSTPKVQLGRLAYHIEPSSATQQAAYAKASAFYTATAGVTDNFNRIAADSAYIKRTARIDGAQRTVSGLQNPQELTRWAFNAKTGAISPIMEIDNNYLIATLTAANENGYTPVEEVAPQIVNELGREKIYEQLAAKMSGASSLETLSDELVTPVSTMESINYNTVYIQGLTAMDPALVGAVAGGVPQGQLSKPIRGATGVYVVEITAVDQSESPTSAEMERARLEAEAEYSLATRALDAINTKGKVTDDRAKYF